MTRPSRSSFLVVGLTFLWLGTAASGYLWLGAYHSRPGSAGSTPDRWPGTTLVPLDVKLPTLLVFIHPRCPCSSASLAELTEVKARCQGRFTANLVTFDPEGPSTGWDAPEDTARLALPGVTRWRDPGGREARRFGVQTSGHVLLFDPSGRRLFSGGITLSRGHEGGNPGQAALVSAILGESIDAERSPVFGCSLLSPTSPIPAKVLP